MSTRCDSIENIDITRRHIAALDSSRRRGDKFNSRAIIDAYRRFEWKDEFSPGEEFLLELAAKTKEEVDTPSRLSFCK